MNDHRLPKWVWPSLLALLGIAPSSIAIWFRETLTAYLSTLSPIQLSEIVISLLGISTLSLAWCIYQRPWLQWEEPTGTWVSRLTTLRYCAKCKGDQKTIPLTNESHGWSCPYCRYFWQDPQRPIPPLPQQNENWSHF